MAKIQIKNEKNTPFGGIFPIMDYFDRKLGSTIDSALGLRCKFFGYEYREIIRSLMCIYFCGGSCIEDVSNQLVRRLSLRPELRTCSSDTILLAIEELTEANTTYVSDSGNSYDFNTAEKLNNLLLQGLIDIGQLVKGGEREDELPDAWKNITTLPKGEQRIVSRDRIIHINGVARALWSSTIVTIVTLLLSIRQTIVVHCIGIHMHIPMKWA